MSRPKYLLDTNVISEIRRSNADGRITSFLLEAGAQSVFLSVLTLGELRAGAAKKRLSDAAFARHLSAWIDTTEDDFTDRILGVDKDTATLWGELSAGRTRPVFDTLLAATALAHGMTLVTRNTRDVADTGVQILNPWT